MSFNEKKIIPDLRVYESEGVSKEWGRAQLKVLEASGVISPRRTQTGRCFLSMTDAEKLAANL